MHVTYLGVSKQGAADPSGVRTVEDTASTQSSTDEPTGFRCRATSDSDEKGRKNGPALQYTFNPSWYFTL